MSSCDSGSKSATGDTVLLAFRRVFVLAVCPIRPTGWLESLNACQWAVSPMMIIFPSPAAPLLSIDLEN
jgi:hypothetical protein